MRSLTVWLSVWKRVDSFAVVELRSGRGICAERDETEFWKADQLFIVVGGQEWATRRILSPRSHGPHFFNLKRAIRARRHAA